MVVGGLAAVGVLVVPSAVAVLALAAAVSTALGGLELRRTLGGDR